ncbi:MAG: acylphosphatase [Gammaproteobacteria bacterium]|nr:acylphosphatase [Gammaproteobacteria bacterium]
MHYIVTGKVQGVFFRQSTRERALALQLTGWVRNLENGNVEVVACGERERLDGFELWLHQGPARAQVTHVLTEPLAELQTFETFDVKR